MSKRAFNPEMDSVAVIGSDGSRYLQEGVFYGAEPDYRLIGEPVQPAEDFELIVGAGAGPEAGPGATDPAVPADPVEPVQTATPKSFTFEELEALEMPELRVIGDALGVKGRSKVDLVAEINAAQSKAAAE